LAFDFKGLDHDRNLQTDFVCVIISNKRFIKMISSDTYSSSIPVESYHRVTHGKVREASITIPVMRPTQETRESIE